MKNFFSLMSLLLLVGCGPSLKVTDITPEPDVDFSKYKTFDYYKVDATGTGLPETFNSNLPLIKQALTTQLEKNGIKQSSDNPDLLVNIGLLVEEKAQTRETDFRTDRPMYIGQRNYSWKSEEVVVGYYKEGELDVHLVDAVSKSVVWQGAVSDILPGKSSKIPETVNLAVTTLFDGFPTRKVAPKKK